MVLRDLYGFNIASEIICILPLWKNYQQLLDIYLSHSYRTRFFITVRHDCLCLVHLEEEN